MVHSGPAQHTPHRFVWRETETSWTPTLIAALLGLELEVDPEDDGKGRSDEVGKGSAVGPPRDGCVRVRGCPGTEVTLGVPTLKDLKQALSFNGTHREPDRTTRPHPMDDDI